MVVWCHHGTSPPDDVVAHALGCLAAAADERFGAGGWTLDTMMRQVPDHYHAHARDEGWWHRRSAGNVSRFTVVGGSRAAGRR